MDEIFYDKMDALIDDLTPVADIAILLGMSITEFRLMLDDEESELSKHFYKKLAMVRRSIRHRDIELAEANSPTAMEAVNNHLKNMLNSL